MCIGCNEGLSIEHILITCSDFMEARASHFTAPSLRILFQEIVVEKIFNSLKENIFKQDLKFQTLSWVMFTFTHVLSLVKKKIYIYILCNDKMCIALV